MWTFMNKNTSYVNLEGVRKSHKCEWQTSSRLKEFSTMRESGQTNSNTRTIPEWQQPKLNKTGRKQEPNQALIWHNSMRVPCIFYDS